MISNMPQRMMIYESLLRIIVSDIPLGIMVSDIPLRIIIYVITLWVIVLLDAPEYMSDMTALYLSGASILLNRI